LAADQLTPVHRQEFSVSKRSPSCLAFSTADLFATASFPQIISEIEYSLLLSKFSAGTIKPAGFDNSNGVEFSLPPPNVLGCRVPKTHPWFSPLHQGKSTRDRKRERKRDRDWLARTRIRIRCAVPHT